MGADVADLTYEGKLLDFDIVDFEISVRVRLAGVEDLFYGAGAEGLAAEGALYSGIWSVDRMGWHGWAGSTFAAFG